MNKISSLVKSLEEKAQNRKKKDRDPNSKLSRSLAYLQQMARGLITPISILAVTGLFFGIILAVNKIFESNPSFDQKQVWFQFLKVLENIFVIPFKYLAAFFAVAIALTMSKKNKGIGALTGLIAYVALLTGSTIANLAWDNNGFLQRIAPSINGVKDKGTYFEENVMGIGNVLRVGVLGGIIAGIGGSIIHNRLSGFQFPTAISFFGGIRFSLAMAIVIPAFGMMALFVPYFLFMIGLNFVGRGISQLGAGGSFIYGFTERMLIPTGLHHILNSTLKYTAAGGSVPGFAQGSVNIFQKWLELTPEERLFSLKNGVNGVAASEFRQMLVQATGGRKQTFMMLGLPAVGLAMYMTSHDKKRALQTILPGVTTASLTGVTEPIEFLFLFSAPLLFVAHGILAGIGHTFYSLQIGWGGGPVGLTMGGVIENVAFGFAQGGRSIMGALAVWGIALGLAPLYFGIFYFGIKFLDAETPGRFSKAQIAEAGGNIQSLVAKQDSAATKIDIDKIVEGLGGADNIKSVTACLTRLRVQVKDKKLVKDDIIKSNSPTENINRVGANGIQVIYGPIAQGIADRINEKYNKG